jgi:hypothetical protein
VFTLNQHRFSLFLSKQLAASILWHASCTEESRKAGTIANKKEFSRLGKQR